MHTIIKVKFDTALQELGFKEIILNRSPNPNTQGLDTGNSLSINPYLFLDFIIEDTIHSDSKCVLCGIFESAFFRLEWKP